MSQGKGKGTEEAGHHHRSSLKQKNKPFKGGARSKSRGRTESRRPPSHNSAPSTDLNKKDRRNRATLLQQAKRAELTSQRRMYAGPSGMPRIIAVIPVTLSVNMEVVTPFITGGTWYSEKCKQNLSSILCRRVEGMQQAQWLISVLEAVQIADCVMIVACAADEGFDLWGQEALAVIRAIGVSSSTAVLQSTNTINNNTSQQQKIRTQWLNAIQSEMSSVSKIYSSESLFEEDSRECVEMERVLSQQHLNGISWRELRPYMVPESVEFDGSLVRIQGFMRGGKAFSANKLVHIPILGSSFQVARIDSVSSLSSKSNVMGMEVDTQTQVRSVEEGETLEDESAGDPFSSESLQRTAEAMMMEQESINDLELEDKKGKLVPKGTSSYQAAWLEDEDINEGEEETEFINEAENDIINDGEEGGDEDKMEMDMEEHNSKLQEHRRLCFTERHFPDEIELDNSTSARMRLQKYRGVQSLRTSTWDANENLPYEYSKIFRFANVKHSRKLAIDENDSPFTLGQKVNIYLEGVTLEQAQILMNTPTFAMFGLLKHEQRKTVVNFSFTRAKSYEKPMESKEEFVTVLGFRRFVCQPILSEHSTTPLHKLLRHVSGDDNQMIVGTIYAPVTFTPAPILLFHLNEESKELLLAGIGSVMDLDPQRTILKRITLTGSPYKVHRRSAVVRFMFSRPEDINWFRPVELTTRLGARGHIRDSLGTHGYMKCLFDRQIFHHDTICMHLHKRIFPKWTTRAFF